MALLEIQDKFTIEVPSKNGENEIIEGYLAPVSKQFLKDIKKKYDKQTKEAQKLKKENNELIRLNQKISNLDKQIEASESEEKLQLLKEQQALTELAYELSDKVEEASIKMQEFDPYEAKAFEHIENRVTSDKQKRIVELCESYGYALILNTINKDIEEGKQKEEND